MTPLASPEHPLAAKTIVITRPAKQSQSLADALTREGAHAVCIPLTEIVPTDDFLRCDAAIARLHEFSWIVFTSVNGVELFLQRVRQNPEAFKKLARLSLAANGPATAQALASAGLPVHIVPATYVLESLVAALKEQNLTDKRILLARGAEGRSLLPEELQAQGAKVEQVVLYRTVSTLETQKSEVLTAFRAVAHADVLLLTSPSGVRSFLAIREHVQPQLSFALYACIGPVTAEAAQKAGLAPLLVASDHTAHGLVASLRDFFAHKLTEPSVLL